MREGLTEAHDTCLSPQLGLAVYSSLRYCGQPHLAKAADFESTSGASHCSASGHTYPKIYPKIWQRLQVLLAFTGALFSWRC
jgi:hypothetical protein